MVQRDSLQLSTLFVGAGPASLAGAIRLADLVQQHNDGVEKGAIEGEKIDLSDRPIMVIEKAPEIGAHTLSGAILDPKAMEELIPDWLTRSDPCPVEGPAMHDQLIFMTENPLPGMKQPFVKAPILPPTFHNDGNHIASLNRVVKWLASIAESKGVQILPNFPGAEVLYSEEDGRVLGVRTGDRGIDKKGEKKDNYEPGNDLIADVTIFGEGSRGSLTKDLVRVYALDRDRNPQIYSTGVKELWKVKPGRLNPGQVIHTAGFPLSGEEFGGGFIYAFKDDHVSLGFVVSLDSPDPFLDPHRLFSKWKQHPFVAEILAGGEVVRYGAKTIPEGGWFSIPRPYFPGGMLIGDSAGFLNISRLKGIHLSMKSGMLAAETAFEMLRDKAVASEERTSAYWHRILESWVFEELWKVRNFRQCFQGGGLLPSFLSGMVLGGLTIMTGGLLPPGRLELVGDHERMQRIPSGHEHDHDGQPVPPPLPARVDTSAKVAAARARGIGMRTFAPEHALVDQPAPSIKGDGKLVFDKVTDVYHSGSTHEEDQPPHLVVADTDICHTRCVEEYGNPCQYFCPAAVYEMHEVHGKGRQLQLNFSNCVHCKTCDIRDPYQIITWVTPEGSGGPNYAGL